MLPLERSGTTFREFVKGRYLLALLFELVPLFVKYVCVYHGFDEACAFCQQRSLSVALVGSPAIVSIVSISAFKFINVFAVFIDYNAALQHMHSHVLIQSRCIQRCLDLHKKLPVVGEHNDLTTGVFARN